MRKPANQIFFTEVISLKTNHSNHGCRRVLALLLTFLMVMSMLPGMALAAQPSTYRDPAEHWMNAGSRTKRFCVDNRLAVYNKEGERLINCPVIIPSL